MLSPTMRSYSEAFRTATLLTCSDGSADGRQASTKRCCLDGRINEQANQTLSLNITFSLLMPWRKESNGDTSK